MLWRAVPCPVPPVACSGSTTIIQNLTLPFLNLTIPLRDPRTVLEVGEGTGAGLVGWQVGGGAVGMVVVRGPKPGPA